MKLMCLKRTRVAFVAAAAALALSSEARADSILVTTIQGNDCSGVFGQGFSNCAIPTVYDPDNSPVIIKFNADGSVDEINSELFPTISGDEFSFMFGDAGTSTGTWSYTPGTGDPASLVSFLVAKGGPAFNLFSVTENSGWFFTPTNPANGGRYGLSHLTFYDGSQASPVPEPGTMLLLGSGLAAAAGLRRRRQKNAV